jgi:hypothetical protein
MANHVLIILALAALLLAACQPTAQSVVGTAESPTPLPPTATPMPTPTMPLAASPTAPLATHTSEPTAQIPPTAAPTEVRPTPEPREGLAYEIRPIEEVSAHDLPQITDITDKDAVLVFESSIPLACSVVYGKTTAYGMISVDQDMGGGAHTDHHPPLSGLEPDTEYHYRVQGTAADGTLYISDDMVFRTSPVRSTAEVNLASLEAGGRVVAVSSNFGGAADDEPWGANGAIDGNRGTAWSSNGDGDEAFFEIELAELAKLHAVEVWTRSMSDGTAQIFAFTLTTDAGEVLGPFSLQDAEQPYRFEVDTTARSLRLDVVESSGGNTGLIEFAVYGTPVGN